MNRARFPSGTMNDMHQKLIRILLCMALSTGLTGHGFIAAQAAINKTILGCWGDADKGDSADLKLLFVSNGSMIQYDENREENKKRTFGAWEMPLKSTFLTVYWPAGHITRYNIKRIGPILHFSGMNGVSNFTLRKLEPKRCWENKP